MKARAIGLLSLGVVVTTALWVILLVISAAMAPNIPTLADRIEAIDNQRFLFAVSYANAGLLTLVTVAMFAGFYVYCQGEDPLWALVGLLFVPMYGLANGAAYLSQVFVVPRLLELYHNPETVSVAALALELTIHDWSGSAVGFVNGLAYALLGVPSIIFGLLMARKTRGLRVGGGLLMVSGGLSIAALTGLGLGSSALASLSLVSGVVFLVALLPVARYFLRQPTDSAAAAARPQ